MNTQRPRGISVVIPVYNSGSCLPELARRLTTVLRTLGREHEVILVDDGSTDNSWEVIRDLTASYPGLGGIRLMHNEGQANATLCGLAHVSGEIVATMDDDLQHRPDQLPRLIDALEEDPRLDCVLGRFEEKHHAFYRNWGSALIRAINALAFRLPKGVRSSAFRVMRRPVADALVRHGTANPAIPVLLFGTTRRVRSLPIEHAPRHSGRSTYSLAKQFRLALDNICNATMLPLRVVAGIGLATCGLSVALLAAYLIRFLMGKIGVPGWTTVVVLVTFFSGVILLSLGVIGEYMVRVLREVRQRPNYFIREKAGVLAGPEPGETAERAT